MGSKEGLWQPPEDHSPVSYEHREQQSLQGRQIRPARELGGKPGGGHWYLLTGAGESSRKEEGPLCQVPARWSGLRSVWSVQ